MELILPLASVGALMTGWEPGIHRSERARTTYGVQVECGGRSFGGAVDVDLDRQSSTPYRVRSEPPARTLASRKADYVHARAIHSAPRFS